MGRRAHKPDPAGRRQVEAMAGYGAHAASGAEAPHKKVSKRPTKLRHPPVRQAVIAEKDIARVLAIDPKTLRKHYREELDTGQIKASAKVAESLFRKATGDGSQSVTAAIFWLKTRAGWKETVVQEQTGEVTQIMRRIVSLPEPVADMDEWQRRYAPPLIEHQPASSPQKARYISGNGSGD